MRELLKRAGSLRLTIILMLILAVLSAAGTVLPPPQQPQLLVKMLGTTWSGMVRTLGLADLYHSWIFQALMVLLTLNMAACLTNRWPATLSSLRGDAALRRPPVASLPADQEPHLPVALRRAGFRQRRRADRQLHTRGVSSFLFHYTAHASLILIMLSAFVGSAAGFVATQRGYVGEEMAAAYNWSSSRDMALPFTVLPGDLEITPYPLAVRVGVRTTDGGKRELITTYVGGDFRVKGVEGTLRLASLDIDEKSMYLLWSPGDGRQVAVAAGDELGDSGLTLVPVQFRGWDEQKAVKVPTRILVGGRPVTEHVIEVNHPLTYGGIAIFLTDYGRDASGLPYVGFQFVRDPGEAGVWAGSILFLMAVTGALFVRHSCVVAVPDGDIIRLHLSSRGNRRQVKERLLSQLPQAAEPGDGAGDAKD